MKSEDVADATARALDLLAPGDPARSDPPLARDPRLAEEMRQTREAAAAVWLAVSPLEVAPPEVLQAVLDEISPHAAPVGEARRYWPLLAASGWAAAAAVAFFLWPDAAVTKRVVAANDLPNPSAQSLRAPQAVISPAESPAENVRVGREIVRLQERLPATGGNAVAVPRVIGLHAPGAPRRTPEEARARVQAILAGALRSALEAESGAPGDPADLVIERGWPVPSGDGVVRHRHFPESAWQDLGLLRSAGGEYFDPASQTIWWPDADGKTFLGRKSTASDDLAAFDLPPELPADPAPKPRAVPEGFVIENPQTGTAEVVIDQLPPPEPGTERFIVLTDDAGRATSFSVQNTASTQVGSTLGTLVLTLPNTNGLGNFQLIERSTLVGNPSVGTGGRVIVEGGP